MKYDITHSCGCVETVELFGKAADRERRIARIALDNLRRYLAGEALRNRVR